MPAATTEIDWPGIRQNSLSLGIRGAARAASVNLTEEEQERFVFRVLKRAAREGWEDQRIAVVEAKLQRETTQALPLSSNVLTGVQAMQNSLADDDKATKTALSRAFRSGSEHLATLPGHEVLKNARNGHELAKGASTIHGWDASRPDIRINIFADQAKLVDAVEVESDAIRMDESVEQ